jgi:hypothetical protein
LGLSKEAWDTLNSASKSWSNETLFTQSEVI